MATLNLACEPANTRDQKQILIQNDSIHVVENQIRGSKISIHKLVWDVNSAIQTSISLPINGYAEFHANSFIINSESNVKFIAVVTENSVNAEKQYENDNTWFSYANNSPQPLGKFTVLSGTDNNRMTGVFKFYNGSPSSNISNISGGTYDVSLSIIAGV